MQIKRACPVCRYQVADYLFTLPQSPGPIVKCTRCGFIFVNPINKTKSLILDGPVIGNNPSRLLESSDVEDIQGTWEQAAIEQHIRESKAKKINARKALEYIHSSTTSKGRLLDLGCFCGVFLSTASEAGWDCHGIEPLVAPAIYARGKFGLRVVCDTLRGDTYPPEFFDVVTAFQVFEHLVHPGQVMQVIHHILKPHGLLLIEVPNINTITVPILASRHRHFTQDHVSFFSQDTLKIFLERYGYQIIDIFYPSRVMSIEHFIWWVKKCNQNFADLLLAHFPENILERTIHISLGDIIAVLAGKTSHAQMTQDGRAGGERVFVQQNHVS